MAIGEMCQFSKVRANMSSCSFSHISCKLSAQSLVCVCGEKKMCCVPSQTHLDKLPQCQGLVTPQSRQTPCRFFTSNWQQALANPELPKPHHQQHLIELIILVMRGSASNFRRLNLRSGLNVEGRRSHQDLKWRHKLCQAGQPGLLKFNSIRDTG